MGAQPNDFKYFLTYEGVKTEILFAPEGWDSETIVNYRRSESYFGMIRSFALPLHFVLDGAQLLRRAYYKYGIEAGVIIEVQQLDKRLNQPVVWGFNTCFIGDIDFSKFEDNRDFVSVTLMESGISRNIKAYEGVKFEYALTGDDVVNMNLPGVKFNESATSLFYPNGAGRTRDIPATDLSSESFKSGFIEVQSTFEAGVTDTGFVGNANWFVKAKRDITVNIKGKLKGVCIQGFGTPNYGFSIRIMDNANNIIRTIHNDQGTGINLPFDFDFDETIPLANNQQLYFYIRTDSPGGTQQIRITEGEFTASYNSVSEPSDCKGLTAYNLYKRIMAKISPGAAIRSYLLNTRWADLIFTSGDGIREITDAKIKITFKEFYDTINGIDDGGFGIENIAGVPTAALENSSYFTRSIRIFDLGEVKECSLQPAEEFLFSSIKIGYNDGNTDEDNGREEYNSGQEWQLPITRVQKDKNWISPTRADQYGIEKIRVDYNVKKTQAPKKTNDISSDNDTFMVYCELDGDNYRPVLGESYDSVTGLTNPDSAYNLILSPKHNLLRHQGYLKGTMDRMDSRYINFASGDKNTELTTVIDGILVKEKENIIASSLTGKYFLPVLATVLTKMPRNTMWLIDNMTFGYVEFIYRGTKLKGYLMDVPVDIARNTEQKLTLLLTHDNNLLNLV